MIQALRTGGSQGLAAQRRSGISLVALLARRERTGLPQGIGLIERAGARLEPSFCAIGGANDS